MSTPSPHHHRLHRRRRCLAAVLVGSAACSSCCSAFVPLPPPALRIRTNVALATPAATAAAGRHQQRSTLSPSGRSMTADVIDDEPATASEREGIELLTSRIATDQNVEATATGVISLGDESSPSLLEVAVDAETLVESIIEPALSAAVPASSSGQQSSSAVIASPASTSISSAAGICDDDDKACQLHTPALSPVGVDLIQSIEATEVHAPPVSKIIKFAIPAMGVWLCGPILSMIDTSAVGLLAGTAQQAALNPAVSVTDYGGLLVAFMYTATTNLVAAAQESDRGVEGKPRTARSLITSLQLGLYVGVGFGAVLGIFSRQLLRSLIGNDAMDPVVFAAAMKYVRIRCLGMPAAVVIGSAQSACLGMQDVRSPLYVLLAAAVVNAIGDAIFVGSTNPLIGGAAGAAWATVFSQYSALALFVAWLKTKPHRGGGGQSDDNVESTAAPAPAATATAAPPTSSSTETVNLTGAIMDLTTKSEEGKGRRREFRKSLRSLRNGALSVRKWALRSSSSSSSLPKQQSTAQPPTSRGFLAGRFRGRDMLKLPALDDAKEFWPYVIPVTTTAIGRISGYIAMSHVCSSTLGTTDMAAQAIIFAFFCVLTPVCDSLNLTAQSFVPSIFEKKKSSARARALRQTLTNFSKVGAIFGAILVGLVASIPLVSKYFTADLSVISSVNAAIPGLAVFFSLSGLVCVGEGMLLGQKDLKFLGNAYGAYFFAVPYFLLRLKRRALAGLQSVGVGTMWETFSVYQVIRCGIWFARMKQLERRAEREVNNEAVQQLLA